MDINGVTCTELYGSSPVFSFRNDNLSCRRVYSCDWENVANLCIALRGTTASDGTIFTRQPPHQFYFQTLNRMMTCVDVSEVKGAGIPRNNDGTIITGAGLATSSTLVYDENTVGVSDKAHVIADYSSCNYAVISDDNVDNPVTPVGAFPNEEWDRYTEWNVDFSSELITIPYGAYKYVTGGNTGQPVNQMSRIPIAAARITAKTYNLPFPPLAGYTYAGAVNQTQLLFFLMPYDNSGPRVTFTAPPETLLYLYMKTEPRSAPNGDRYYNVTHNFAYRALKGRDGSIYGHNAAPFYSSTSRQVTFERYAADITSPTADNSAPFRLRNFGYLWSPQVPTLT